MFEVNKASEKSVNQYLNEVEPDGIYKGLMLEKSEFVKKDTGVEYIELTFRQSDSGKLYLQKLWAPKPGGSIARIEHMYLGLVRPVSHPVTGRDIRFGEAIVSLNSFEDVYNYYNSKIDWNDLVPVDLKVLYKVDKVTETDGKREYPKQDTGSFPFINSEFLPNKLDITKDLANLQYPMFLNYKVIKVESLSSLGTPAPSNVDEKLPF